MKVAQLCICAWIRLGDASDRNAMELAVHVYLQV